MKARAEIPREAAQADLDEALRPRVAVADTPDGVQALSSILWTLGYQPVPATAAGEAAAVLVSDLVRDPLGWIGNLPGHRPVILLSGETSFPARLAAARAGVDAVIARPVDVSELAEWLNDLARPSHREAFSVLIVDDDALLAETYAAALESAGMITRVASDPAAALAELASSFPDLVLLDMQMPGANGIELARIIRQSRRFLSLPIVFLSAERDPASQLEARRLGGDDFISKPVDPGQLVSLVRMRAERSAALRAIMDRDSLTGLLNHARFADRLALELERSRRTGSEATLAIIDLDHFKLVNDRHGHPAGDRVLRAMAHALTAGLRRTDIVGRYGGEEFAAILLDTAPDQAWRTIDQVRLSFSLIDFEAAGRPFRVSFSAGLAGSRRFPSAESLVREADRALYEAKAAGRDRVALAPRLSATG
jgi:diguanylate cyclase (GGDEF)-like protein